MLLDLLIYLSQNYAYGTYLFFYNFHYTQMINNHRKVLQSNMFGIHNTSFKH